MNDATVATPSKNRMTSKCLALLLVFSFISSSGAQGVRLRLEDSTTSMNGRLEIFYQDEWGTICDDQFDIEEASIACRQLGFGLATAVRSFGPGVGTIVLDDVNCNGNEASILDCYHDVLGKSNCGHSEDVGVVCSDVPATSVTPTLSPEISAILNNGKFRLVGGPDPYQGRVEVFVYDTRDWLPLCSTDWDFARASFVCQKLGYRPITSTGTGRYDRGSGLIASCSATTFNYEGPFNFDQESCQGVNESDTSAACSHDTAPDVVCSGLEPGREGHIRFVGGTQQAEGRVEIFEKNLWKGICSDGWTLSAAQVACQQVGLPSPQAVVPGGTFGSSNVNSILQDSFDCTGQETSLTRCSRTPTTCNIGDAAVRCGMPAEAKEFDLRLVDGGSTMEGRVEILYQGEWGTICGRSWINDEEMTVICNQLGFLYSVDITSFGPGTGLVVLSGLNCNGNEERIVDCYHSGLGNPWFRCEDHKRDLGIVCSNVETVTPIPDPSITENGKLRLVDGPDPYQGRVEVYAGSANTWATICGTDWDFMKAEDVCQKLNYRPATSFGTGRFATGTGAIATCPATEYSYDTDSCRIVDPNDPAVSCTHANDAYVVCSGYEPGIEGKTRLVNGSAPSEGRIEIYDRNEWRTVCSDDLTTTGRKIVCRQLGLPPPEPAIPGGTFGRSQSYGILEGVPNCSGRETRLVFCPRTPRETPCMDSDAAIQCGIFKDAVEGDVRLSGGDEVYEGRVEIYHRGQWGQVCDSSWEDKDARVVCRQLGYRDSQILYSSAYLSPSGPVWLTNLACSGKEDNLTQCGIALGDSIDCRSISRAEVTCSQKPYVEFSEVRVIGSQYPNQGRVEVLYGENWGTICHDKWDLNDANVICQQLGFSKAVMALDGYDTAEVYGSGTGEIILTDLECSGSEPDITQCYYGYAAYCIRSNDAGVVCYSDEYPSGDPRPTVIPPDFEGGSKIPTYIGIGLSVGLVLVSVASCCVKMYARSKEPTIVVIPPSQPDPNAQGNSYNAVPQEDLPPSYDEVAKDPNIHTVEAINMQAPGTVEAPPDSAACSTAV